MWYTIYSIIIFSPHQKKYIYISQIKQSPGHCILEHEDSNNAYFTGILQGLTKIQRGCVTRQIHTNSKRESWD